MPGITSFCRRLAGLGLLIPLLLSGCGGGVQDTPEDRIRALLDEAEAAVENRSTGDAMDLVSSDYRDGAGRDRRALRQFLMGYLLRHQTIHVVKKVSEIRLTDDRTARIVIFAGVAGDHAEATDSLQGWRGDLLRLEAELVRETDDWRLSTASWRRASHGELL